MKRLAIYFALLATATMVLAQSGPIIQSKPWSRSWLKGSTDAATARALLGMTGGTNSIEVSNIDLQYGDTGLHQVTNLIVDMSRYASIAYITANPFHIAGITNEPDGFVRSCFVAITNQTAATVLVTATNTIKWLSDAPVAIPTDGRAWMKLWKLDDSDEEQWIWGEWSLEESIYYQDLTGDAVGLTVKTAGPASTNLMFRVDGNTGDALFGVGTNGMIYAPYVGNQVGQMLMRDARGWITNNPLFYRNVSDGSMILADGANLEMFNLGLTRGSNSLLWTYFGGGDGMVNMVTNSNDLVYYPGTVRMGIGTNAPWKTLSLFAASGETAISIRSDEAEASALYFGEDDTTWIKEGGAADNLIFGTSDTERIHVTSVGNVGIGTNAPPHKFSVLSLGNTTSAASSFYGDHYGLWIGSLTNVAPYYLLNCEAGSGGLGLGGTTVFRVMNSGNVGIGTNMASSTRSLHIWDDIPDIAFTEQGNGDDRWVIGVNNAGDDGFFFYNDSTATYPLFLDESGNVGIGTTSPGVDLEINGTDINPILMLHRTDATIAGGQTIGGLQFVGDEEGGNDIVGYIAVVSELDWNNNDHPTYMKFQTTADGESVSTERMRITSSGNVGIGTNNPSAMLHLAPHSGASPEIWLTKTGLEDWSVFQTTDGDNGLAFYNRSDSTYSLFLDEAGQVGIGTTSPEAELQVSVDSGDATIRVSAHGDATDDPAVTFYKTRGTEASPTATQADDVLGTIHFQGFDTARSVSAYIRGEADAEWGTAGDASDSPSRMTFFTTPDGGSVSSERMRITSTGNVGIGTNAPHIALSIFSGSGLAGLALAEPNRDRYSFNLVSTGDGGLGLFNDSDAAYVQFWDEAGQVGIGTTSPQQPFHVFENSGTVTMRLESDHASGAAAIIFEDDTGSNRGMVGYGNSAYATVTDGQDKTFFGSLGATDVELIVNSASAVTIAGATGNVGIGTNAPQKTLHVVGETMQTPTGSAVVSAEEYILYGTTTGEQEVEVFTDGSSGRIPLADGDSIAGEWRIVGRSGGDTYSYVEHFELENEGGTLAGGNTAAIFADDDGGWGHSYYLTNSTHLVFLVDTDAGSAATVWGVHVDFLRVSN